MRLVAFFLSTIFLFSFCSSQCNSGQIDINAAPLSDLDKLTGIGPVYAQAIIDGRLYSSLEDLDRVKGIGPKTLEKIKSQGLACISSGSSISDVKSAQITFEEKISLSSEEKNTKSNVVDNEERLISTTEKKITGNAIIENSELPISADEQTESIINLNSDTKTKEEKIVYESRNEQIRKYSIYAFIIFLLVVTIFLLFEKHERTKDYGNNDY